MSVAALLIVSILRRLMATPVELIVRLADDADEVWEPFLQKDSASF